MSYEGQKVGTYVRKTSVALTVDGDGNAVGATSRLTGRLERLVLLGDIEGSATITVTKTETEETVATGTAIDFAPDGSLAVPPMVLADESLSIDVWEAGEGEEGALFIYWS